MRGRNGSQPAYDMMNAAPIRLQAKPSWRRPRDAKPLDVAGGVVVDLVPPKGTADPKVQAILFGVASIGAGLACWVIGLILEFMLSFGSEPSAFPLFLGVVVGLGGVVAAVATYRPEDRRPHIRVTATHASFRLPGHAKPLVVAKEHVRVATIDPTPVRLFRNNKRFPIADPLPSAVFADALDRGAGVDLWDPGDPGKPLAARTPPVVPQQPHAPLPDDAEHEPGWADVGGAKTPPEWETRHGYLFSGDGSALPVFRANPLDLPNVAVVFHEPQRMPPKRASINPFATRCFGGTRARTVAGVMAAAHDPDFAARAFDAWGVVRPVTADDVLEEGLRPPKPLKGWRAVAFAAMLFVPLILRIVTKHRF